MYLFSGVKTLIEALNGDTEALYEDGILLGSTEYPYSFTPTKMEKGRMIHAISPKETAKDNPAKGCTVYKTDKHIIISTYMKNAQSSAVRQVQKVAKYINKNLE